MFWVIKIFTTTLGETGGDAVTMTLKLGYAVVHAMLPGGVTSLLSHQAMRVGAGRMRIGRTIKISGK
jgi:uncharacterized membrane-anchored protein